MIIRDALEEDAPAVCGVLRRSILELCAADHGDDPTILAHRLRNKTPECVASRILLPGYSALVAVEGAAVLGVGLVTDAGEVHLNCVSPDARFRGISRGMMRALEARAVERGSTRCTLTSTETARRFYLCGAYAEEAGAVLRFPGDCPGYRMVKFLAARIRQGR